MRATLVAGVGGGDEDFSCHAEGTGGIGDRGAVIAARGGDDARSGDCADSRRLNAPRGLKLPACCNNSSFSTIGDVSVGQNKWLNGITWSMVDRSLILRKTISKSLRGRKATDGKELTFNLRSYPMVMEELTGHTGQSGPMIINEKTMLPWRMKPFQAKWREIARTAGVPDHVQNRDSRAGGITEATDAAGQDFELVRRHAGHSQPSMTARYSRNHVAAADDLAKRRVEKRRRNE